MLDTQLLQGRSRSLNVIGLGMMVRKNPGTAEKSGEHDIASSRVGGTGCQQIRRHDAQLRPQFENVPALAPQDSHPRIVTRQWIAFPGNRFDQRGLPAPIRSEDAYVFARFDAQRYVAQSRPFTAHYAYFYQFQQRSHAVSVTSC